MFTPKPKNRKRKRGSQRKRTSYNATGNEATLDTLREEEFLLNAEIGSLEDLLSDLEAKQENEREMSRQNILPPPQSRLAHHQRTEQRSKKKPGSRSHGLLQFVILLTIAGALAFWLFFTGG